MTYESYAAANTPDINGAHLAASENKPAASILPGILQVADRLAQATQGAFINRTANGGAILSYNNSDTNRLVLMKRSAVALHENAGYDLRAQTSLSTEGTASSMSRHYEGDDLQGITRAILYWAGSAAQDSPEHRYAVSKLSVSLAGQDVYAHNYVHPEALGHAEF